MKKRIIWLDSLKGFAILCVVIGHIADGYLVSNIFPDNIAILNRIWNIVYIFHMPLFFIISGSTYRMAYFNNLTKFSGRCKKEHFRTQILNLVFLYIIYSILIVLFKIIASTHVNRPLSLTNLLFIWGKPIAPYWYLYVLIIFYLLFKPLVVKLANKRIIKIITLFLFTLSLISGFVSDNVWFSINHLMFNALFFYIGIYIVENNGYINRSICIMTIIFSLACIILYWNSDQIIRNIPIISTVSALGVSLGIYQLFKAIKLMDENNILSKLGQHSLEIYLLHVFFTAGNRVLLPKIGINSCGISFILNTIISVFAPILISVLLKRIHLYNLIFRPWLGIMQVFLSRFDKNNNPVSEKRKIQ